jgi:sugar lactone lactonase YvrE
VSLVLDVRAVLGEGPIWDAVRGRLAFVDIDREQIHLFDPVTRAHDVMAVGVPCSAIARTGRGDWIAAAGRGFVRLDPETGDTTTVALVEPESNATRMNDGAVDPRGRFWAGSMSTRREDGRGTLYRLDPDGRVQTMLGPVTTSNGPAWSPDGHLMYYVDTRTRRIDVFDYDLEPGTIANRRVFVDLASGPGRPDGVTTDAQGGVWVALWDGAAVRRYTPDGRLDREWPLPVRFVTKCAFGGPDLTDLYITTASAGLTSEARAAQPHAGGLFHLRPGVRGVWPTPFAG